MAYDYTLSQLAIRVGLAEHLLEEFVSKGLLEPKVKGKDRVFSARQARELEVAFQLSQSRKIGWDRALQLVRDWRHRRATIEATAAEG